MQQLSGFRVRWEYAEPWQGEGYSIYYDSNDQAEWSWAQKPLVVAIPTLNDVREWISGYSPQPIGKSPIIEIKPRPGFKVIDVQGNLHVVPEELEYDAAKKLLNLHPTVETDTLYYKHMLNPPPWDIRSKEYDMADDPDPELARILAEGEEVATVNIERLRDHIVLLETHVQEARERNAALRRSNAEITEKYDNLCATTNDLQFKIEELESEIKGRKETQAHLQHAIERLEAEREERVNPNSPAQLIVQGRAICTVGQLVKLLAYFKDDALVMSATHEYDPVLVRVSEVDETFVVRIG